MIIFTNPECKVCPYRMYTSELIDFKSSLEEEPVPNCNRSRCLWDNRDITRFINNGWIIKLSKGEIKDGN